MGTRSMILSTRPNDDDSRDGFTKWPFMTTHTWAEYPRGKWTLDVRRTDRQTYKGRHNKSIKPKKTHRPTEGGREREREKERLPCVLTFICPVFVSLN